MRSRLFDSGFAALSLACLLAGGGGSPSLWAQGGAFTVQVGAGPLSLVRHDDLWHYHKGTNAPQGGWRALPDTALDGTWALGTGGFGFGDPDINNEATTLSDMLNQYTTLYLRRSFVLPPGLDTNLSLTLRVDFDDGFVAYLGTNEIARANTTNSAGTEVLPADTTGGSSHEASCCDGPNPQTNVVLGPVGARLQPGTNLLALVGLNQRLSSSDFHLIPDLFVAGGTGASVSGDLFTLVQTNAVTLSGSNTVAGSTRVVVNGVDAALDTATGTWTKPQALAPGLNRLFIAALDAQGAILAATNLDVISEMTSLAVGGVLASDTTWTRAQGIIRVTNDLIVANGVTLTMTEGVVVLLSPNASIRCRTNSLVAAVGTEDAPVYLLPASATTNSPWGELSAQGPFARLSLSQVELVSGQLIAHPGATVTAEDSVLRDYHLGSRLFVTATNAYYFTLRRCRLARYDQIRFAATGVLIEGCLFEQIGSDASDFADHFNVQVLRTTYRYGDPSNSNTDALDLGNNRGMIAEQCLIHDFPDKAISIADGSEGAVVRNCVFYNCGIGISCYGSSNCVFLNNTIAGSVTGILLRQRGTTPPGDATGTNNIVWGNTTNIGIYNGATFSLAFSDVGGSGVFPGPGNINADPQFVDAAHGDYRLQPGSPALSVGAGGADMGAAFPVGGLPAAPFHLASGAVGTSQIRLSWRDDAENEAGFLIERATNGGPWEVLGSTAANVTNYSDFAVVLDQPYAYRVRATNYVGQSRASNPAHAVAQMPVTVVGGPLTGNTVWSPALGTILVLAPVTVPAGLSLTIEAGTLVKLTNSGSLQALADGAINVAGTEDHLVAFVGTVSNQIWGGLSAVGSNATLTVRYADIQGGPVGATNGATMLLEDCYLHEFKAANGLAIGGCENAAAVIIRRCHFKYYHETLWRGTLMTIEETLFEWADNASSDALDFDGVAPGSSIRRCTFRHGPRVNTDAIDLGPGLGKYTIGITIADTLMYDFPHDGGISAGEGVWGVTVSNCLIYACRGGIKGKETPGDPNNPTTLGVYQCTIVDNLVAGFTNFLKSSCSDCLAGQITNSYNNIVHGNPMDIVLLGNGVLTADHSDFGSTNFVGNGTFNAGEGILTVDPLFVNRAARDYRLQTNSPCRDAGRGGAPLGCYFPVGAPMAPSHPRIESLSVSNGAAVLRFWADSEKTYTLQTSELLAEGTWTTVTNVASPPRPRRLTFTQPLGSNPRFYRLVTPAQP